MNSRQEELLTDFFDGPGVEVPAEPPRSSEHSKHPLRWSLLGSLGAFAIGIAAVIKR